MSEPDAEMRAVNPLEISPGEQYLWKTPKLTSFNPTQELVKSNDSISKDNDVLLTDEEIKLFL